MAFSRGCYALYAALGLFRYSILGKLLWFIYLKKKKNFFLHFFTKKISPKTFLHKKYFVHQKKPVSQKKIPQRFTSSNFFLTIFFLQIKLFFYKKNSFSQLFLPVFNQKTFFYSFSFLSVKTVFTKLFPTKINLNLNCNKTTKNLIVTTQMKCTLSSVLRSRNIFSMKCWGTTVHEMSESKVKSMWKIRRN